MASVAIIGQGYMGNAHAAAWASAGQADSIKYICTPRPKEGSVPAAKNAKYITDLDIILRDPDVKYVSVCTPTPTHKDIAVALLAAGKHVLLEKPVALTVADAKVVAEAATKSSGSLMVAHVVRFFLVIRSYVEYIKVVNSVICSQFMHVASPLNQLGLPGLVMRVNPAVC